MRIAKIEFDNGVVVAVKDNQFPLTIGRARECDICIAEPCVSRVHCELFLDNAGNIWLKDLSSNGTVVDHILLSGESVRLSSRTKVDLAGELRMTVSLTNEDGVTLVPGI